jgi:hypothetical protein
VSGGWWCRGAGCGWCRELVLRREAEARRGEAVNCSPLPPILVLAALHPLCSTPLYRTPHSTLHSTTPLYRTPTPRPRPYAHALLVVSCPWCVRVVSCPCRVVSVSCHDMPSSRPPPSAGSATPRHANPLHLTPLHLTPLHPTPLTSLTSLPLLSAPSTSAGSARLLQAMACASTPHGAPTPPRCCCLPFRPAAAPRVLVVRCSCPVRQEHLLPALSTRGRAATAPLDGSESRLPAASI